MNIQIIQETGVEDDSTGSPLREDDDGLEKIPGLNKPVKYFPTRINGPKTALGNRVENPYLFIGNRATEREIRMLGFMNQITEKPGWERKVFDDAITQKWRSEVKAADKLMNNEATLDYCIAELREKSKHFEKTGLVAALNVDCAVIKSDIIMPEDMRVDLIDACRPLQDRPEAEKDWHPRSNNQVLNLVHPSLYSLVYGRTRVLQNPAIANNNFRSWCGRGTTIPTQVFADPPPSYPTFFRGDGTLMKSSWYSSKFQWLPCEVAVGADGSASIESYINNLHPDTHSNLYGVIERIIEKALPLWDEALAVSASERRRIEFWGPAEWTKVPPSELPAGQKPEWAGFERIPYPELDPKVWREWERNYKPDLHRIYIHPEPADPAVFSAEVSRIHSTGWLKKHMIKNPNIQVIVKLAGIELTPENRAYQGGNWHLEGQLNEHIVATALYYYDCENVTESGLEFRQTAQLDGLNLQYEQSDFGGLEQIFGTNLAGAETPIQNLGRIKTCQGRLLAFANTLQHRVTPFELADATKPGHRRFIALWLVDPTIRVISTAYVPPQQMHWWPPELLDTSESTLAAAAHVPPELRRMILNYYKPNGILEDEALKYRLELMDERSQDMLARDRDFEHQTDGYFLCEH